MNQIACSNVGGDRNRPWANAVQKIGESQENVNDARCLAALEDDQKQSVFNFGLGVLQDNSRPCPCSLFQAIFDRRFILRRLSSPSTAYFVPTFPGFLNGFFFGYACAYSISRLVLKHHNDLQLLLLRELWYNFYKSFWNFHFLEN